MRASGVWVACGLVLSLACGGGGGPASPPSPSAPPATISGRVVANPGGGPVAGAQILAGDAVVAVTGADGSFSLPNRGALSVSIAAEGYLTRKTRLSGERSGLAIDLISLRPPFELEFYRQLTRDAQDGSLTALARWTVDPAVYVFTNRVDRDRHDTGEPLPAVLVDLCRSALPGVVSQVTAGHLSLARFESGTDASVLTGPRAGTIVVTFRHRLAPVVDPAPDCVDSASIVASNTAAMSLCYSDDQPFCPLISPGTIAHEMGHALGLHHACFPAPRVGAPYTMCRGSGSAAARRCEAAFDPKELFHSAILYSRPPGNVDADEDPPDFAF